MSEIKPAMPREEWRAQLARTPEDRRQHLIWAKDEADADGWLTIHGLAALALHGQPFGFSREDAAFLRDLVSGYESGDWGFHFEEEIAKANSMADRVEALLPPE